MANIFDGMSGRFTLIPLNIDTITDKVPDNGEILADFTNGELSLAVVNENTGKIIGILNPFTALRQKDQELAQAVESLVETSDGVYEITALLLNEVRKENAESINKVNKTISNMAALQAMNGEV